MDIIKTILAFVPLLWLLVSMGKIRMTAYKAGIIALCIAVAVALTLFGMQPLRLVQASIEGLMLAIVTISWVIVAALFLYNMTVKTGSMEQIKHMLANLSPDRRIQALIIAFAFGGFLEAVAGFGTAVAIPAGILIIMGFQPFQAAVICLIANTIPVAFGVLGVPIVSLAQVTGLSLGTLSLYTALQLIPFIIFLPFVLVFSVTGNIRNIKGVTGVCLASGIAFALGQTLTAFYLGPELAAVVGSLLSLLAVVLWIKVRPVREVWLFKDEKKQTPESGVHKDMVQALKAWSPYLFILVFVFATRFLPFLKFLDEYPFRLKVQFYFGPEGKPLDFQLMTGAGTILFVSAILGGLVQNASLKNLGKIFLFTLKQVYKSIITVVAIVVLSKIMAYSGMISYIAVTLAQLSGGFYPIISPFIGAVCTFLTGSDTSSNVLFGDLQKQTAIRIGAGVEWIAASNASGATAGKMISPQSIAIATAATDLTGQEGKILNKTVKYCVVYVLIMGIIVYIFSNIV